MSDAAAGAGAAGTRAAPAGGPLTRFLARDVDLPARAGTLVLLTMDNGLDGRTPNTMDTGALTGLSAALDLVERRAAGGEIVAVGLTGKPFGFAAGADLRAVASITSTQRARAIARLGHECLRRLGELGVPSFAYIGGSALGGGLEIALHCGYRTVSAAVPAVALPECALGLVPGWGGCYLLPRLTGAERALQVIVHGPLSNNRMLTGVQAAALGVADVAFEPADFLERSLEWTSQVLRGEVSPSRRDHTVDAAAWDAAVAASRAFVDDRLHGAAPAPYRAVELVAAARTTDRDTAFAAEDDVLTRLVMSEEFRSGVYAFELTRRRAKRPAGVPEATAARPVRTVGLVGAGLMARQLAHLVARRLGAAVVLTDVDEERVAAGVRQVHGELYAAAARAASGAGKAARLKSLITGSSDVAAFADADLVVEAVFEDLAVKLDVLRRLETVVGEQCLMATNTSALSVTAMAESLTRPERMIGLHFFNPVAVMPLLEVVRTRHTDDTALATAFAVGRALGKSCVLVADSPAFVVNRLLGRLLAEVLAGLDDGMAPEDVDHALDPLGLPMSPFVLLQLVGPPVALSVARSLQAAFGERFAVPDALRRLVAAGRAGVWSTDERGRATVEKETRALLGGSGVGPPGGATAGDADAMRDGLRRRVERALAQEARLILDEGVVADPRDVDLCLLLGAGWPSHLGGILPYLDRTGVAEAVTGRRFLPRGVASLPVG